jgi:hypothetical protein
MPFLSAAVQSEPTDAVYIVVAAQSTVTAMTQPELLALYTGRSRALANGMVAVPFDQERDGQARATFYRFLTNMDLARINSYWARLHFTGQVQQPQIAGDAAAMAQRLRADPQAIGYLIQPPQDASLRIVFRLTPESR